MHFYLHACMHASQILLSACEQIPGCGMSPSRTASEKGWPAVSSMYAHIYITLMIILINTNINNIYTYRYLYIHIRTSAYIYITYIHIYIRYFFPSWTAHRLHSDDHVTASVFILSMLSSTTSNRPVVMLRPWRNIIEHVTMYMCILWFTHTYVYIYIYMYACM